MLKHSAATNVKVEMTINPLDFELKVTDNGKGFEVPLLSAAKIQTSGGRGGDGLKNMRQRLATIGGECLVSSRSGEGTAVKLRVRFGKKEGNGS